MIRLAACLMLLGGAAEAAAPTGHAELGAAVSGKDEDNAKFREFWYDSKSAFALTPAAGARWDFGVAGVPFYSEAEVNGRTGLERRAHDGDLDLEVGSWGLFKLRGSFERIGHQFAHDAPSVYGGVGTGTLVLDDLLQRQLQTSTTPFRASILDAAVGNAAGVDLGLRRDRFTLGADVVALDPFTVSVGLGGEQRKGARSYGGLFGSPGTVNVFELAEPIDYDTLDLTARIGYAGILPVGGIPLAADVAVGRSAFTNHVESMTYENLFAYTDSKNGGAAVGRSALAPSNSARSWSANVSTTLPWHIGLSGHASLATMDQNAVLVAAGNNLTWHGVLPLPRERAQAQVVSSLYSGSLTLHPVRRVDWRATVAQRRRENRTPEFHPDRIVVTDTTIQTGTPSEYVSYTERTAEFEQRIDLGAQTGFLTAYENEVTTFENGSASRMAQNRVKLAVDTRIADRATVRVSGEHAVRTSAYPDYTKAQVEIPWMRKFYDADRDRDAVTLMAMLEARDDLTISGQHTEGLDDYHHSLFGLQKDRRQATTLDASWDPEPAVQITTFYSRESYETHQRSRQWSTNGAGDPYSKAPGTEDPSNWDLDSTTVINTVGVNAALQIVPDRLTFNLDGTASSARGRIDFTSALGVTPIADANAFLPPPILESDESQNVGAMASLTWRFAAKLAATFGYRYDLWKYRDFLSQGYDPVLLNAFGGFNSLLSMDTLPKDYEVHSVFARLSCFF